MTPSKWKESREKYRKSQNSAKHFFVTDYDCILFSEISSISSLRIDRKECKLYIKVRTKAGQSYRYSIDYKKVYRNVVKKSIFGKKIVKVEVSNQWYFDNAGEELIETTKELIKAIKKGAK